MDGKYQTIKVNEKPAYTPDEMMWAIKHMTTDHFLQEMLYDKTGKYDGIFVENKE